MYEGRLLKLLTVLFPAKSFSAANCSQNFERPEAGPAMPANARGGQVTPGQ